MRPIDYLQKMQEGGSVSPEMYTSMIRKLVSKLGGEEPEGMYTSEGGLTKEGYAKMLGADPESISIDTLNFKNPANYMFKVSGKGAKSGVDVGGTTQSRGILPLKGDILDPLMREKMDDPFERMDMEMLFRAIKPESYQKGGMVFESAPADNTAHSQMDRLIAENEINQMPRTPFSFLNRDRIDKESQELMDVAMSASMPMMGATQIQKFSPKIMNMMSQLSKNPNYENNLLMRALRGYNRRGAVNPSDEINIKNLKRYLENK